MYSSSSMNMISTSSLKTRRVDFFVDLFLNRRPPSSFFRIETGRFPPSFVLTASHCGGGGDVSSNLSGASCASINAEGLWRISASVFVSSVGIEGFLIAGSRSFFFFVFVSSFNFTLVPCFCLLLAFLGSRLVSVFDGRFASFGFGIFSCPLILVNSPERVELLKSDDMETAFLSVSFSKLSFFSLVLLEDRK